MPMHDWSRVSAGTFHAFHNSWISELQKALNAAVLPSPYYALGEQRATDVNPDVLALHELEDAEATELASVNTDTDAGLIAVTDAPPRVRVTLESPENLIFYLERQRSVVIRHSSGDRIVALIEIVSPANKHSRQTVDEFIDKVVSALRERIHVLLIDPQPRGSHDPNGIHQEIWQRLLAGDYQAPDDLPLTLASYSVGDTVTARVEETRVGNTLTDMPMFLKPQHYILVPLEETYMAAWAGMPSRWRQVIDS